MTLYRLEREVDLRRPVLVMTLDGWIDAGFAAISAMATVVTSLDPEPLATFDSDLLIDYRSRRPTIRINSGLTERLTWPEIQLRTARQREAGDILLLTGPEPDANWHAFTETVVDLARRWDVRRAIALGAFPGPAPHTRPTRVVATAATPDLVAEVGSLPGVIEAPAGAQAALEWELHHAGIPAVGLWARVPHYLAGTPYPPASIALLERLEAMTGMEVDTSELRTAAQLTRDRIDQLIAQSPEHREMVAALERQVDAESQSDLLTAEDLPSGEELAAELERFLRGEGPA